MDDNPPGLFEIGLNEDTLEDVDLLITKGPNSGTTDPRANILGCLDADEVGAAATDCRDTGNDGDSLLPSVPPPGHGPDWGDLFTGVLNGPDRVYVQPTFQDAVDFDGTYIVSGGNGVDDYIDWGAITAVFIGDHISAGNEVDDTTMVSSGSDSNDDLINTYAWGTDSVPSKDDITNAYCYATLNELDELVIYCGVERLSNDGASHVDIELNKNEVGLDEPPPCDKPVCYMVGDREDGDMMVSLDFTNGGDFGSLEIRIWDDLLLTWGDPVVQLDQEGCNSEIMVGGLTIPAGSVCGFNNNDLINGGPWPNFIKSATPLDGPPYTSGMLPRNAFSEFGLNVNAILGAPQCISYLQIKTRTSHSFTSQLKDFALRPFPVCGSAVRTEIHDSADVGIPHTDIQGTTVKVGTTLHDLAEVMVNGPGITQDPTGTVDFYLYDNDSCDGALVDSDLGVSLAGGTPDDATATAVSKDFSGLAPGDYSFHAVFNSDTAEIPSSSLATEHCEVITIEKYESEISTQIHEDGGHSPDIQGETIYVGPTIHDHAYVSVKGEFPAAPAPTGSVTFYLYETLDCTGSYTELSGTLGTPAAGEAITSSFTPDGDTVLSYSASYAGDVNYLGATDEVCEPLDIIKYDSELATEIHEGTGHSPDLQGGSVNVLTQIHDHAYWEGVLDGSEPGALDLNASLPVPTGDVTFNIYPTEDCSGEAFSDFGGIAWPQTDGLSAVLHPEYDAETALFTPPAGTLSIKATWAEDSNYHGSEALCEVLTVNKVTPTIETKVIVRDRAEVMGGLAVAPTGLVTIYTYRTNDCSGDPESTEVIALPASGVVEQSTSLEEVLEVGNNVASYIASYDGDSNYLGVDHNCELVEFSVLP